MNTMIASVVGLITIAGGVYGASKVLVSHEELKVSQEAQDYIRYEQEIEVINEQIRDIKYDDDGILDAREQEKIEELEERRDRYKQRQGKKS